MCGPVKSSVRGRGHLKEEKGEKKKKAEKNSCAKCEERSLDKDFSWYQEKPREMISK